jgi:undecaprenyl phosphate N,N'-diacetylbacillosamine 1-phosphate transferase
VEELDPFLIKVKVHNVYKDRIKRIIDIIGSLFLSVVCSGLFALIVLVYIVSFQYPFFFRQERIGKNERIFWLIKFRTLNNSDKSLQKRRFAWGDFLRLTSLDELPQLWNVLKGEMSLIGPRPLPVEYLPLFSEQQRIRHSIRPGITGLAQVSGRHSIGWKQKFDYDIFYVRHLSFWLDLKIVLKTMRLLVFLKKDISLTERKFTGDA